MAGIYRFHNKFHATSHHTITGHGHDGGSDPIGSIVEPFQGIFYNILTDNDRSFSITTNSVEWWTAYTLLTQLSGNWAPSLSLYNTVNSLSDNWNLGYNGYLSFRANSGSYDSVYATVCANSASWNDPFFMYTNRAQEYTRSKTFSGTNLTYISQLSSVDWDLDSNQVTFFSMLSDTFFNNPSNIKKGGTYFLSLSHSGKSRRAYFDTAYRFNRELIYTGFVDLSAFSRVNVDFISDGTLMYGDIIYYLE